MPYLDSTASVGSDRDTRYQGCGSQFVEKKLSRVFSLSHSQSITLTKSEV